MQFGINTKIGCSVYINKTTLSESCASLKEKTFLLLTGMGFSSINQNEKYVATFGNSLNENPGDWVSKTEEKRLSTVSCIKRDICS